MASKINDRHLYAAICREMTGFGCKVIPCGGGDAVAIIGHQWAVKADSVSILPPKAAQLLCGACGQLLNDAVELKAKHPPQTIIPETASALVMRVFGDAGSLDKVKRLPLHHNGLQLLRREGGEVFAVDPRLLAIITAGYNGDINVSEGGTLVYLEYGIDLRISPQPTAVEDIPRYAALAKIDW